MKLPITQKEFEKIMSILKTVDYQLYAKLWTYKMNNIKEMK
jgi:hypothetical protein